MPFLYGTVGHKGIIGAANLTLAARVALLQRTCAKHPEYKLIVTGHSLGGGIALVIAMLLNNLYPKIARRMECHAFSPPPVVSESIEFPNALLDKITIYVHGRDCVPRLSIRAAALLDAQLRAVDNLPQSLSERLESLVSGPGDLPASVLTPTMPSKFLSNELYPILILPASAIYHILGE
jgi:pimeloyl-ACP methyl ester carboxylesterase